MKSADYWIAKLGLKSHQEGGYFAESYRSDELLSGACLPVRYRSERSTGTAIYFLLKEKGFSAFHRLQSDETWHFYTGSPFEIFVLTNDGDLVHFLLGNNPEAGEVFQLTILRGKWFAARLVDQSGFGLAGCTVAPGFHFDDFELAKRKKLAAEFPRHNQLITELTYRIL
ncbi:MAG: cupin domain-containing protein [Cyclobacteriaceae bacterium]|nr:cupin domain-containing protein [Cyclobacteriaceae bacterium]